MPDRDLTVRELMERSCPKGEAPYMSEFLLEEFYPKPQQQESERASLDEAKAKLPVFSKIETKLTKEDAEKKFIKYYPKAIPGTLKFDKKINMHAQGPHGAFIYTGVAMENDDPKNKDIGGSLNIMIETYDDHIRLVTWLNIDG